MASADTGFRRLRVFFIKSLLLLGRPPKSHEVTTLSSVGRQSYLYFDRQPRPWIAIRHQDDSLGVGYGQWSHQNRVDDRKNDGVGGDAGGERYRDRGGGPLLLIRDLPAYLRSRINRSIVSLTTEHFCCFIHRAVSEQGRFVQFEA